MTTQYGFFIDSSRCTGCKTCELACKDYKDLTPDVSFRRIYEYAGGDWQEDNGVWHQNVFAYYLSIACNHCEDPACTKVCPSGAMHKREDGFVVVDEDVCIGCRYCHMACPYGAPQYNAAKGHMTKCDGCHTRVADGKKPICVESCPLRALDFGPIEELRQKHGQLAAAVLKHSVLKLEAVGAVEHIIDVYPGCFTVDKEIVIAVEHMDIVALFSGGTAANHALGCAKGMHHKVQVVDMKVKGRQAAALRPDGAA